MRQWGWQRRGFGEDYGGRRGKKRRQGATPMAVKNERTKKSMEKLRSTQETGREDTLGSKLAGKWTRERWNER